MIEKITNTGVYFLNGELSNKYFMDFFYEEEKFVHVEQAFMWKKAMYFKDSYTAGLILKRTNPKVIYDLGRNVKFFGVMIGDDRNQILQQSKIILHPARSKRGFAGSQRNS